MKQQFNRWLLCVNCSNSTAFFQSVITELDVPWLYDGRCCKMPLWVQIWDQLTSMTVSAESRVILISTQHSDGNLCFLRLALACSWQALCLSMTQVYGI